MFYLHKLFKLYFYFKFNFSYLLCIYYNLFLINVF